MKKREWEIDACVHARFCAEGGGGGGGGWGTNTIPYWAWLIQAVEANKSECLLFCHYSEYFYLWTCKRTDDTPPLPPHLPGFVLFCFVCLFISFAYVFEVCKSGCLFAMAQSSTWAWSYPCTPAKRLCDASSVLVGVWLFVTLRFQPSPLASKLLAAPRKGEQSVSLSQPVHSLSTVAYPQQVLCSAFSWLQVFMGAARPQNRTARAKLAWPNGRACGGGHP